MSRSMGVGPSILRGRVRAVSYVFGDPDHPDRVTGELMAPAFTDEDRALLLALEVYEASLCPGSCGLPREVAWHADNDGWLEAEGYVCLACTALRGGDETAYSVVRNVRPSTSPPPPPFTLGETTLTPAT